MINLTEKDADTVLSYLRDNLTELNKSKINLMEMYDQLTNRTNPFINAFVDGVVDDKESFTKFGKTKYIKEIKTLDEKISKVENYILLLTTGSAKE